MHTSALRYCSLLVQVSGEVIPVWPLPTYLYKVSVQNMCVVLFRPGYGSQNYTCFAHVTQGFICLILLLPSSDSSFHCCGAPSAGCTNEHSTEPIHKPRVAVGRDSIVCQGPSAEGARADNWEL